MFKSYLSLFFTALLFVACSSSSSDDGAPPVATPDPVGGTPVEPPTNLEWNLIFEDTFDSDLSQWNIWESGAFNNEIQLYQEEQLSIENGILTIAVERENIIGPNNPFDATPKDFDYVSGRIETKTTFGPSAIAGEQEYRFVASIRMPEGLGMWPAFWSFGDPWPTMGEIDIIEARGNLPMEFSSNIFFGTEPNIPLTRLEDTVVEHDVDVDITADFHTYELIWTATTLEIRFDDERLHLYQTNSRNFISQLLGKKQQIVINAAVGGVFFPGVDPTTFVDSSSMEVDWVRVYKR